MVASVSWAEPAKQERDRGKEISTAEIRFTGRDHSLVDKITRECDPGRRLRGSVARDLMAQEDWQQVLAWVKQALMGHVRLAILACAVAGWAPSESDAAEICRALQGRIDVEDDGSELAERYRGIHNSLPLGRQRRAGR